jgi:biotin operon repressor
MSDQGELFKAETKWFHVFKDMIDNGDVSKMGPTVTTVYLVIKAHTNFSTGRAFPAHETIAEKTGLSVETVKRSITTLVEMGYVIKGKAGRSNLYTLREKLSIKDSEGEVQAMATWDYIPTEVRGAIADLRNVLFSPGLDGAKVVHIEHLNVHILTGAQAQVIYNHADGEPRKMPTPELQRQFDELMAKAEAEEAVKSKK